MPLVPAKCPECGGLVEVDDEKRAGLCQHCGQPFVVEDAIQTFNTYYQTTNNYNTTHNYGDGAVVNVYEDKNKDFVIEAGVLKEYHGESQEVIVPDNVTVIGEKCFEGQNIRSVSLPENIVRIENDAFCNCKNLNNIKLPSNLTYIGSCAFSGCESLKEIIISDKVKNIGMDAFKWCFSLEKTNYTGTIEQWVEILFSNCSSNPTCFSYDLYINDELLTNAILDNVTVIRPYSFYNCKNLKSVSLPETVTKIEAYTFSGCKELKTVHLPKTVTSIGKQAFSCCANLRNMVIPNGVDNIGFGVFYGCQLESLIMPLPVAEKEKKLLDYFQYEIYERGKPTRYGIVSENLKNIKITGGNEIPGEFFSSAKNVESILLPESITKIGASAFSGCEKLNEITLPNSLKELGSTAFKGCKSLNHITLPSKLECVGFHIFADCNNLLNIDIPEEVSKKIQNRARTSLLWSDCFDSYWKQNNKCSHCGGEFNLFSKCKNCGKKKDY